jgi:hypothetical protein
MKDKNNIQKEMDPVYRALVEGPPKPKKETNWMQLRDYLEETGITPGEALKILKDKINNENVRFNWKMIRFTLFIWERIEESQGRYLKPKIDTVRAVVRKNKFRDFYLGYFPGNTFDEEKEIKLLNKLIAEKPQKKYFKEGYYYYYKTHKLVPQEHLERILWEKNK